MASPPPQWECVFEDLWASNAEPVRRFAQEIADWPTSAALHPAVVGSLVLSLSSQRWDTGPEFSHRMHLTLEWDEQDHFLLRLFDFLSPASPAVELAVIEACSRTALEEVFLDLAERLVQGQSACTSHRLGRGWRAWAHPTVPEPRKYWEETERYWLAKPVEWGASLLPPTVRERKERLYQSAWLPRALPSLFDCPCVSLAGQLLAPHDDVWALPWNEERWAALLDGARPACREGDRRCGGRVRQIARTCHHFGAGNLSWSEAKCRLSDLIRQAVTVIGLGALSQGGGLPGARIVFQAIERPLEQAREVVLRELLGNPYRPPPRAPLWLGANDGAAERLARTVAAERRWELLPLLGDALEDAGCTSPEVLDHCRSGGEHLPGCWVVDWALGLG